MPPSPPSPCRSVASRPRPGSRAAARLACRAWSVRPQAHSTDAPPSRGPLWRPRRPSVGPGGQRRRRRRRTAARDAYIGTGSLSGSGKVTDRSLADGLTSCQSFNAAGVTASICRGVQRGVEILAGRCVALRIGRPYIDASAGFLFLHGQDRHAPARLDDLTGEADADRHFSVDRAAEAAEQFVVDMGVHRGVPLPVVGPDASRTPATAHQRRHAARPRQVFARLRPLPCIAAGQVLVTTILQCLHDDCGGTVVFPICPPQIRRHVKSGNVPVYAAGVPPVGFNQCAGRDSPAGSRVFASPLACSICSWVSPSAPSRFASLRSAPSRCACVSKACRVRLRPSVRELP